MVGVSDTTIFKILHDHFGMTMINDRWVPRKLTPLRVEILHAFLNLYNKDQDGVLSRIITGDKFRVIRRQTLLLETKMNLSRNKIPCKNFKMPQSAEKLMATVFWNLEEILLIER